jgi:hypothetical protein
MKQRYRYVMLIAILMIGMAGCSRPEPPAAPSPRGGESVESPLPTPTDEEETVAPTPAQSGAGAAPSMIARAKEDLAERLAVDPADIEVIETQEVVWRDSSLGCPQPGMVYAQVLTDGMLVRLRHGDSVYEYHSGGSRGAFLCENPAQDK